MKIISKKVIHRILMTSCFLGCFIVGFNARDVSLRYGFKVQIREYLARVKMLIDLFITKKQPKFLGAKIEIS